MRSLLVTFVLFASTIALAQNDYIVLEEAVISLDPNFIWLDEPINVSFNTNGYTFYKGTTGLLGCPVESFLELIAVKADTAVEERIILPRTTSLEGYVTISTPSEALEFVRLFTDLETHFLFEDSRYIEIHYSDTDILRGNLSQDRLLNSDFEEFGLFEAITREENNVFIVERCLLDSDRTIIHSRETVSPNGQYTITIVNTIASNTNLSFPIYE